MPRHLTSQTPTPEGNSHDIDALWDKVESCVERVKRTSERADANRENLVEISGRDGRDGKISDLKDSIASTEAKLQAAQEKSAASQGKRIESNSKEIHAIRSKLEGYDELPKTLKTNSEDIALLKQLRAQLYALAVLAMAILGGLIRLYVSSK